MNEDHVLMLNAVLGNNCLATLTEILPCTRARRLEMRGQDSSLWSLWVDAGVDTALMPMDYGGMKITCQLISTLEDRLCERSAFSVMVCLWCLTAQALPR